MQAIEWKISKSLTPYETALSLMEERVAAIAEGKASPLIWLLEHPPLFTAGTSAKPDDLLDDMGFPVYSTGRGGQFTYHGPGQRIIYVMLDLKQPSPFCKGGGAVPDIRAFVTFLESWMITSLRHFGLEGCAYKERVGVWVRATQGKEAKIGAIGIRVRRHVSFHGLALNIDPDLSHFKGIVPCGIRDYGVTSLHALGIQATMEAVDDVLKTTFHQLYHA